MNETIDRTRLEIVDLDASNSADTVITWSGSIDEFDITQLSEEQQDQLLDKGYVVTGGGAAPLICVRFVVAADDPIAPRVGERRETSSHEFAIAVIAKVAEIAPDLLALVALAAEIERALPPAAAKAFRESLNNERKA